MTALRNYTAGSVREAGDLPPVLRYFKMRFLLSLKTRMACFQRNVGSSSLLSDRIGLTIHD